MEQYIQASGNSWKIYEEDETAVLELHSIYGIVTFKAKGLRERIMVNDMITEFAKLYIQGPIQQAKD
jgi:hypothetical protein